MLGVLTMLSNVSGNALQADIDMHDTQQTICKQCESGKAHSPQAHAGPGLEAETALQVLSAR